MKLERRTAPKKIVADGEQIRNLGEETISCKRNQGIHRCITLRSAGVVKLHLIAESRSTWKHRGSG